MQLKFGRFVSTHNQIGKIIPCDLHMEHLNRYIYTFSKCTKACRCYQFFHFHLYRVAKEFLAALGANITPDAVTRLGKCLGPLHAFFQHYLEDPDQQDSEGHAPARQQEDIKTMAQVLVDDGHAFQTIPLRKRHMIGKYHSLFHKHSAVDLRKWLRKTCENILLST